uniref:Cytochrome P450 2K1-like n=1 Tax=Seriola dumerili TaxID=41447 RepID=A0A3B4U7U0_SERDU
MEMLDLFLQTFSSVSLLGTIMILLLFYLVSTFSFTSQEDKKEPPGPRPLPLLGNLLQLDLKRPYETLLKFSKKYGSVFTIYMGPKKVVVLAGYKTVKEALVNHAEEFGERAEMQIMKDVSQGHGVLWSNGESWKEMRRFALTNLRDYGMGKKACEDKICEESQQLTEVFKKFKGTSFDMTQPINYAVSNIICSMVYGSRFEYDDPEFTSLVDRTNKYTLLVGSPSIQVYNQFPWIGRWIANRKLFHKLYEANKKMNLELVRRLKETLNPQMCRGFVDAFLVRKQHLEKSEITNSHFHNENLLMTVIQLFGAGTETTSTTIRWGLLFMTKYPKIQDQVQEELSRVIGSRQVQVEDRKNLPFTDAVIHETQRLANISPMSLPHKTSQDVTFQGYFIKKGTTVYPLLTSVLYDESEWEKPYSFYPAHFLDKDGKFVKRDAFLPFSAGRRICLGESLARMELFIFFTTLLQHFRFTPPPGVSEDELDLTAHMGLSLSPSPHKLCAVPCM